MSYHYHLHRYGFDPKPVKTFNNRKSLSEYMRNLPCSPSAIAEDYFLVVLTSTYSAVYDFHALSDSHLKAVLLRKTFYKPYGGLGEIGKVSPRGEVENV